jgi:hypothetical protein
MDDEADIAILITKSTTDPNYTAEVIQHGLTVATGEYLTKLSALKFASIQLMVLRDQEKENLK